MKITETRKSIIELIEPYTDKTLNEGCLYEVIGQPGIIIEYRGIMSESSFIGRNFGNYNNEGLLNYINHNIGYSEFPFEEIGWKYNRWNYTFTYNKPLHLYTEEEDDSLLDLLTKLK